MELPEPTRRADPSTADPAWAGVFNEHEPVTWRAARRILKNDRQSRLGLSVEDLVSLTRLELMKTGRPPSADNLPGILQGHLQPSRASARRSAEGGLYR